MAQDSIGVAIEQATKAKTTVAGAAGVGDFAFRAAGEAEAQITEAIGLLRQARTELRQAAKLSARFALEPGPTTDPRD